MVVKALKGPYMIKTTHLDVKHQTEICAASSAGDETQSLGVKDNEFLTATIITVKGMYNNE